MSLKVLNAVAWLFWLIKPVIAFGPAIWMIASFHSAAAFGCAAAWAYCVLVTKKNPWWHKW